jgi:SAM dependent carboxyl methyltransferase.
VQVAYSRDAAARSAFAEQAAEDWRRFLAMRSRELRPGARLVVLTMATDDSGDFGYRPVVDALYGTLVDMVDRGLIRKEEFRRMVIPTFGRTRGNLWNHLQKVAALSISRLRSSNCSMAKIVSGLSLKQAVTLTHLARNGLLFAGLRCSQHSRRAWMSA